MPNIGCSINQTTNVARAIFGYFKNMLLQCDTASNNTNCNNPKALGIMDNPKETTDMNEENRTRKENPVEENRTGMKKIIEHVQKEMERMDRKIKDLSERVEINERRNLI